MSKKQEAHRRHLMELAGALKNALVAGIRADYDLGRWIDTVMMKGAWYDPDWPGSPDGGFPNSKGGFNDWCWHVLGFKSRKATYHRQNYLRLAKLDVEHRDTSLFEQALLLGWTKLSHVLGVSHSIEDLRHWVTRIEKESLTENQLRVEARIARGDDDGGAQAPDPAAAARNADPATRAGGQMPEGAAYVGDDGVGVVDEQGRRLDAETGEPLADPQSAPSTRVKFPLVFSDEDAARLFIRGLDIIKRRTGIEGNGECAAMMATSYLATTPHEQSHGVDSQAAAIELENMLEIIEAQWGTKLYTVERVAHMLAAAGVPRARAEALLAGASPEPVPAVYEGFTS